MIKNIRTPSARYEPIGEDQIVEKCIERLGKETSILRQREVVNFIQGSTIREMRDPDAYLTALKNGIYDLKTMTLKQFSPNYFITNALPITYDSNAKCPVFIKFMDEILKQEDIMAIQELFGYFLIHKYDIHKIFLFVGTGRNGKTTLITVMMQFLAHSNYASVWLQNLLSQNERFWKAELAGKMANLADDLPKTALQNTGALKMLTGGSPLEGEKKHKDPFTFVNLAKFICACNEVPETPDDTEAFFARFIIIIFENVFPEGDAKTDIHLAEKLTTLEELSGIFSWALEGAKRLMKNSKFSYSKSSDETREQYQKLSSPIKAFVDDCVEESTGQEDKDYIFQAFIEYCKAHNIPPLHKKTFAEQFQTYMSAAMTSYRYDGQLRIPIWLNIKLKGKQDLISHPPHTTSNPLLLQDSEEKRRNRRKNGTTLCEVDDGSVSVSGGTSIAA